MAGIIYLASTWPYVKGLRDAMLRKPAAQRLGMLRAMNAALLPILEKGLVSPSLIHKVLAEYLEVGGPGTKYEAGPHTLLRFLPQPQRILPGLQLYSIHNTPQNGYLRWR